MGIEGTRRETTVTIETPDLGVPADSHPTPLTDGRAATIEASDVFTSGSTPVLPGPARGPVVGHPLFACRDVSTDASSMTVDGYRELFECRIEEIDRRIEGGDLEAASRLIREMNPWSGTYASLLREMPNSERNNYLGRLYLARSRIEASRGESRGLWRSYYEARGYDLTGDHARARLSYREVMARPAPSPMTAEIREIGRVTMERRRALELEAIDRLTSTSDSIFQQRSNRLIFDAIYGHGERDLNTRFLSSLRALIVSGRAHTVDEAIEVLREDHLRARREFTENPRITADWRVRVWPTLTEAHLEGGTLEMFGAISPRTMTVTVGPEGGVIRLPGETYYFPAGRGELTVSLMGARITEVRRGAERVMEGVAYYVSRPGTGDRDIPREVLRLGGETRREYHPASAADRIHPNTFDGIFDAEGHYETGGLFHFDEFLLPMLEMETEEGLTHLTGAGGDRDDYLISVAERMRSREGSYAVSAACLEEVFSDQFERALNHVLENRSAEVDELREESETEDDFTAGLMTLVSEQLNAWSESGELASADPRAARAWSLYNDMLDPAGEFFNVADESEDAMVDEAIITGITFIPTMGMGSVAAESVEGARVVRLAAAAASVGSRRLLLRFGPRIAALGARAAFRTVVAAPVIATRVAVEAPVMTCSSAMLTGRGGDVETLLAGSRHTAGSLAIFHVAGSALPRPLRFVAESFLGRDLGEWAAGSASRRFGLQLYFQGSSMTAMTGVATGLSYTNAADDRTFAERLGGEGLRMGYMTFLGGLSERGRTVVTEEPGVILGGDFLRDVASLETASRERPAPLSALSTPAVLANLRMSEGRFENAVGRLESLPEFQPLMELLGDARSVREVREEVSAELGGRFETQDAIARALETVLRRRGVDLEGMTTRTWERARDGEATIRDYADTLDLVRESLFELYPDEVPLYRVTLPEHAGLPGRSRVSGSDWGVGEASGRGTSGAYAEPGMVLIRSTLGDMRESGAAIITDRTTVSVAAVTVVHPDGAPMPHEVIETIPVETAPAESTPIDDMMPFPLAARRSIPLGAPIAPVAEAPAFVATSEEATNPAAPSARRRTPTRVPSSERGASRPLDDLDGAMDALARHAERARAERDAAALAATDAAEGGLPGLGASSLTFVPVDAASVRAMVRLGGVSIGTSLMSGPGEAVRVEVRVPGAEAEAAFLRELRAQPETTVEDLGEGRYRVRHARHGEATIEVRRTTELSLAQQADVSGWCDTLPPSEDQGWADLSLYSRPRLESLVDHLVGRGWAMGEVSVLFDRGGASAEFVDIMSSRPSSESNP